MKITLTDDGIIHRIRERTACWLKEHSAGNLAHPSILPELLEIDEYPVYRVTFRAEKQARTMTKFSRADTADTASRPLAAEAVDPWSFEAEKVDGFIHCRQVIELPETFSSSPCDACKGSGRITCPDCMGQKGIHCPECRGNGRNVCPSCGRTMSVGCTRCGGRGRVYNDLKKEYDPCPQCQGTGTLACNRCSGGYVACDICGGKKRLPCARCAEAGSLQCTACSGKGRIVSGDAVEIVFMPHEEKIDIENDDIPASVISSLGPRALFVPHANYDGPTLDAAPETVPETLRAHLDRLARNVPCADGAKVVGKELIVEKKAFYRASYRIGARNGTVWMADAGAKISCEPRFLNDIYSETLEGIKRNIVQDDFAGAARAARSISAVSTLKDDLDALMATARRKRFLSYTAGSLGGTLIFSAAVFPFLYNWRGTSFHLSALLGGAATVNLLAAFVATLLLFAFGPASLNRRSSRMTGGAVTTLLLLCLVYGGGISAGYDPARRLDERQLKREYDAHFPFGLRTLANRDDIEFLESLIRKYAPTGVDISGLKKDLAWMKEKRPRDEANIRKIETAAGSLRKGADAAPAAPARRKQKIHIE